MSQPGTCDLHRRLRWAWPAAILGLALSRVDAVTIRGVVTGDVDHMPWRKGKKELGWCSVKLYREGRLEALTRTHSGTGDFEVRALRGGEIRVVVERPGFLALRQKVVLAAADPPPLRVHLKRHPHYGLIVLPRTGTAITSVPGDSFTIECLAPPTARDWTVALSARRVACPLTLSAARFGKRAVWNATKPGWQLTVRVPDDPPAEMYDLTVTYRDENRVFHRSTQAKAVCIRPAYPHAFRLMPYADFHLNWLVARRGAAGEAQAAYFQAASLLNPLFVSLGDDVGFEGDDHVAMFHYLVSRHLDVPVYLAFGNHDGRLTAAGHEFYFGPRWQTRRLGPHVGLILSYDLYQAGYAMPREQRAFVEAALARFHADPANKLIFLAGHTNPWKPPTPFFAFPFTRQARPWFPGHSDGRVALLFPRLFMHALSVGSMHGWAGLSYTGRLMEFDGFSRDATQARATLLPQVGLPSVAFERPNNGTARSNAATIRLLGLPRERWTPPEKLYTGGYFCDLPKQWRGLPEIRDARLRFAMRRGRYRASKGRILQSVDGQRGTTTTVYLSVDLTEPTTTVTIRPQ